MTRLFNAPPQPAIPHGTYLYEIETAERTEHGALPDASTRQAYVIRGDFGAIMRKTMGLALEPALYGARIECQSTGRVTRAIYDRRTGRGGRWYVATRGKHGHFVFGSQSERERLELSNSEVFA